MDEKRREQEEHRNSLMRLAMQITSMLPVDAADRREVRRFIDRLDDEFLAATDD